MLSNIYQVTTHTINIPYKKSLGHITMETMEINLQDQHTINNIVVY